MKIAIMQPYLFPYLGYFQLINAVDKHILYYRLNFIKKAWMNHNFILDAGTGRPHQFHIPLVKKSSNCMINEIQIDEQTDWRRKLLKKIFMNYKKAPCFEMVYPLLETIINNKCDLLYAFNNDSIIRIARYLDIRTNISVDEPYFEELENQLLRRDNHFPNYDVMDYPAKSIRILEICKNENADTYYNPIGGRTLYAKELFRKFDINLGFIETDPITYRQYKYDFVPGLSIIDVMMFNKPENLTELINAYQVI